MINDSSTASIYADFHGFNDMRLKARENSPEALKEVASQFESMFIQMMLKSMREASLGEGLFDSQQSEFYLGMFDQQIALDLSAKQSLGIAEMMMRQLGHEEADLLVQPDPVNVSAVNSIQSGEFTSPDEFINFMRPLAEQAAEKLGVNPNILIAQSALETGWGQRVIQNQDGQSSHNLFGIKSDKRWSGPEMVVSSVEYRDGKAKKEISAFRSYESYADSFNDYVDFIENNERYQEALKTSDNPKAYIKSLQHSGYATDPDYADKVIAILERDII